MLDIVVRMFDQFRAIFGICPKCEQVFRLSDTYVYAKGKQPHSVFDDIVAQNQVLDRRESRLEQKERELRANARSEGLRLAKRTLHSIDWTFSRSGYDPQDVKVLFDPVRYIVFKGMSASDLREIVLIDAPPLSIREERLQRSIDDTLRKGNYEWRTVRIKTDGSFE